jgi:hypothetical protein
MSAATGLAATSAFSAMDGEPSSDRLAADLFLVKGVDVRFFDVSAALGTGVGERRIEELVDGRGIGRRPMAVDAVPIAGFATGLSGFLLGAPFGEGGGLAFGGAFDSLKSGEEFGDAFLGRSLLFGDSPFEIGEQPLKFGAAGTSRNGKIVHAEQRSGRLSKQLRVSLLRIFPASLNNHVESGF